MMKFVNDKIRNEKGITLIALVITIVVLIILAGVAINLTLGQNGILQRAKEAKTQALISQYKEKAEVVRAEVALENGNVVELDKLKAAFDSDRQKDWVNSTEIIDDNGVEKLKLTTNDGFVFYITASSIEYKSKNGEVVVDNRKVTITASPENKTDAEVSSITVDITVSFTENITGAVGKYAWKKGAGNPGESDWKTLTLNESATPTERTARITSGQEEDGDYYLWVKATVNGKEETVSFGEYKFQAKPLAKNLICRIKSKSEDNTTGVAELGSDMAFEGWTLSYTKNGGSDIALTAGSITEVSNITKGDLIVVKFTKEGETTVQETLNVSELKLAYTLTYSANGGTGGPGSVTQYDINTFTVPDSVPTNEGRAFDGWYPNQECTGNTKYVAGNTVTITSGNQMTIYAKWGNLTAEMIQYNATWGGQAITNVKQALDYLYTQFNNN